MMADIYEEQKRFEDEEKHLRQALELLADNDDLLGFTTVGWYNICRNLIAQSKYDEAFEAAKQFEEANIRQDQISKTTVSSSWGNLWVVYAHLYSHIEDYENAELYCRKCGDETTDDFDSRV